MSKERISDILGTTLSTKLKLPGNVEGDVDRNRRPHVHTASTTTTTTTTTTTPTITTAIIDAKVISVKHSRNVEGEGVLN